MTFECPWSQHCLPIKNVKGHRTEFDENINMFYDDVPDEGTCQDF